MILEIRCDGTMHARYDSEKQWLEVKCVRRRCGAQPGVTVLHRFDIHTGRLVDTVKFASPRVRKESDGTDQHAAAVRSA